jgi:hypothetical protein
MATTKITANVLDSNAALNNLNAGSSITLTKSTNVNANLNVSGNLVVDTNTLFVNSVNDRVGIGTTSPATKLHILDSTAGTLRVASGTRSVNINSFAGDWNYQTSLGAPYVLGTQDNNSLLLYTNNTEKVRITNTGNVGIGINDPSEKLTVTGNISASGTITGSNLVYTSGDQNIGGVKTFTDNIVGNGAANTLPNQVNNSPESILTAKEYDTYEWYPQTSNTYTKAIANGRTLNFFQTALIVADKGTTQPFIYQPRGNGRGKFKMSIVTSDSSKYMSYDCTFYAYGTQYVGAVWNVDIRRAPDVGRAWFSCTITGSPNITVDQVLTGSRGSQITIATSSTPIVNAFQIKSVANRLPSQGEVFTTDGGTFTVAAGGILGTITDAQANFTGALIPSVGIFWPTTMPDGTFYIRGHSIT